MTTIVITGKQPGKTDVTISSTVNPAIKTVVPVTVLSRNLLSYGPASGNGLTATVNSDGSLHITGTATGQWRGFNVKCLDAKGQQLGASMNLGNRVVEIPAGTVSLYLNVISNESTPTLKESDIRIQLESGDTAHDWMRPDNTSLRGGTANTSSQAHAHNHSTSRRRANLRPAHTSPRNAKSTHTPRMWRFRTAQVKTCGADIRATRKSPSPKPERTSS